MRNQARISFNLLLPEVLLDELKIIADEDIRSVASILREGARLWIKQRNDLITHENVDQYLNKDEPK